MDLYIIEAKGKVCRYQSALGKAVLVMATHGHIARQEGFVGRSFIYSNSAIKSIRLAAQNPSVSRIMIATDNDDEGHVIAQDIYRLLEGVHDIFLRVLPSGLSSISVRHDHALAFPYTDQSMRGRLRAWIDRFIFERGKKDGVIMGRALSPLINEINQGLLMSTIKHPAPANAFCMADVLLLDFPDSKATPSFKYSILEGLYLSGHMSYPRTQAASFSKTTQAFMRQALSASSWEGDHVPPARTEGSHDALYPLSLDLSLIDNEAIGLSGNILKQLGIYAYSMFSSEISAIKNSVQSKTNQSIESKLVFYQVKHALGTPATWVQRSEKIAQGKQWIAGNGLASWALANHLKTPSEIKGSAFSREIEGDIHAVCQREEATRRGRIPDDVFMLHASLITKKVDEYIFKAQTRHKSTPLPP